VHIIRRVLWTITAFPLFAFLYNVVPEPLVLHPKVATLSCPLVGTKTDKSDKSINTFRPPVRVDLKIENYFVTNARVGQCCLGQYLLLFFRIILHQ
jgi:hypothetical protein